MSKKPVVVITGASSGIGRATAYRFAKKGATLVLASRSDGALADVAAECERLGASGVLDVPTDVTDASAVHALADATVLEFGRIDVWVNDAAVSVFAPFLATPLEDFRRVLDVNIMGYVHGARAALEVMTRQRQGVLINVASIVGEVPQPYTAAYGMSKAAVRALGVSLRSELMLAKLKKVHVATVLPAAIDTPFFRHSANYTGRQVVAMPPVYSPDRVAKAIVGLAEAPRPELVVGAIGKALVKQHRRTPVPVEAQMALQTDKTHLSRDTGAEPTQGILYAPATSNEASVTGGWADKKRTAGREVIGWAVLTGGAFALKSALGAPDGRKRSGARKKKRKH
ncbi:SDR family oxidoreductase [Planctomonas psychrotolerans]|uniref:SDR family oxidoreductase n=1 Tax=Planctomonas psychrotolerans TaxID=2528712 RepID=UPI00123975DB|nr:SDR family oxidoreductase [Planctomonas psychrotolerans]